MAKPLKRRGNGLGSVWQRPNGSWAWQVTLGYAQDGKRITKSGSASTKTQASKNMAEALTAFQHGTLATPDKVTVTEWLAQWLEGKTKSLKPSTAASYGLVIKNQILPFIGSKRLQAIKPLDLRDLYSTLSGSGLSNRTVRYAHSILYSAFKDAVRLEIITRNPCDIVQPHALAADRNAKAAEAWSANEVSSFLKAAREDVLYAAFYLLIALGLRRGEVCGLQWSKIDLDQGILKVEQSLVPVGCRLELSTPKTKASKRTLKLSPDAREVLRLHQAQQQTRVGTPAMGWVFCTASGGVIHPDNLKRTLTRICKTIGLRRIRIHDLRHTHASLAARAGEKLAVVSKKLGHSRSSFTGDVYRHVFADELETALSMSSLLASSPSTAA